MEISRKQTSAFPSTLLENCPFFRPAGEDQGGAAVRNHEWCGGDSDHCTHMRFIQGQITQSEHLPLALPPTRARAERLAAAPQSLPPSLCASRSLGCLAHHGCLRPRFLSQTTTTTTPITDLYRCFVQKR